MVQGRIHDICDLTLIPPAGEDDGWKLVHVEKAILGVINAIDDTHDRYHEKSPALDKARMVMTRLVEFACMCQNHKPALRSLLVPDTTDAASKWLALLNYHETPMPILSETMHWCEYYEQDITIPRITKSMLAHSLSKNKIAQQIISTARTFMHNIRLCNSLESGVDVVENNVCAIRAVPLLEPDNSDEDD